MSSRLFSVVLWRVSVSKQTIPTVFASLLQTRHIAEHITQSQPPVFPADKRIPVQFEASIESVIASNWDKIEKYASVLKCKTDVVERLVKGDTRIVTSLSAETVCKKLELLVSYKYDPEEIAMFPPLFCVNFKEIEKRLAEMEMVRSYHTSLYLACVGKRIFKKKIAEYKKEMKILGDHQSKLHFVAEKLDCHVNDVYDMIDKGHTHLMTRPPSAIDQLVNIIKEHGFTTEDIRKFPIVLLFNIPEARKRFQLVKKCGILEKVTLPSVLVTNKEQFRVTLRYWMTELSYLEGSTDCRDILKKRLGVTDDDVERMYKRFIMLRNIRAKKLQSCLDVLLNDMNINPVHIVQRALVLYYSPERLHRRHLVLQRAGVEDSRQKLIALCQSETKFNKNYKQELHDLGLKTS